MQSLNEVTSSSLVSASGIATGWQPWLDLVGEKEELAPGVAQLVRRIACL